MKIKILIEGNEIGPSVNGTKDFGVHMGNDVELLAMFSRPFEEIVREYMLPAFSQIKAEMVERKMIPETAWLNAPAGFW